MAAIALTQAPLFRVHNDEIEWAIKAAESALAQPIFQAAAARCHRGYPVILRRDNGRIVEGVIDLAYFDGQTWTVVDFKTGLADEERYRRQLSLYAAALRRFNEQPVEAVLVEA